MEFVKGRGHTYIGTTTNCILQLLSSERCLEYNETKVYQDFVTSHNIKDDTAR